jgi:hypothetical protein
MPALFGGAHHSILCNLGRILKHEEQDNVSRFDRTCETSMATTSSTTNAAVAADETIYSPIVEQGEFELEWRAYLPEDNDLETEHEEEGRISAEYAPTDSWSVELEPEFVRAPSKRLKLAQIQFEHVLQLTREDGHWTNCRLFVDYEHATEDDAASAIVLRPLFK